MSDPSQTRLPVEHGEERLLSCDKSDSNSRDDLEVLLSSADASLRIKAAIEQIQCKIARTKEAIKAEQTLRDENVHEYLKLSANADDTQVQRIKSIFEKKNQKSAHAIAQLQKKLEKYSQKLREIDKHGITAVYQPSRSRTVIANVMSGLKGVGSNIRDGISGFSEGVMGSIKPFQSSTPSSADNSGHLIKESPASGGRMETTLDNSSRESLNHGEGEQDERQHDKHGSYTQGRSSFYVHSHSHSTKPTSDENSSIISDENLQIQPPPLNEESLAGQNDSRYRKRDRNLAASSNNISESKLLANLKERENECQRLAEELKAFKTQYHEESNVINTALQEERYKSEHLEEQMNDLTELHQNVIENLKQNINDIEEKILYQSEEKLRDIYDTLESFQNRISSIEHQLQQQQNVNLNSLENSNAKALGLKLINVVLQVILLLVATVANFVKPLSRIRICFLIGLLIIFSIMMRARE